MVGKNEWCVKNEYFFENIEKLKIFIKTSSVNKSQNSLRTLANYNILCKHIIYKY